MCAVPNMDVFCSSLTSWFPGMLLTYFLNVFEIFPVAPIITGITFVLIIIIYLLPAIEFSLGGSSPYTSTDKTNTNKYDMMIYLLTAIGLPSGGSSTVQIYIHIHKQ